MRSNDEYQNNLTAKKMIITERDPTKMRVKAKVMDEDGMETYWLDVLSQSSSSNKSFNMPDEGDEVWAMIDPKGEEGFIAGSRFNDKDTPPFDANETQGNVGPWGKWSLNKETGAVDIQLNDGLVLNVSGTVRLNAENIILDGFVDLGGEGGQLLHRKGDQDSAQDTAVGSASRVRAV